MVCRKVAFRSCLRRSHVSSWQRLPRCGCVCRQRVLRNRWVGHRIGRWQDSTRRPADVQKVPPRYKIGIDGFQSVEYLTGDPLKILLCTLYTGRQLSEQRQASSFIQHRHGAPPQRTMKPEIPYPAPCRSCHPAIRLRGRFNSCRCARSVAQHRAFPHLRYRSNCSCASLPSDWKR